VPAAAVIPAPRVYIKVVAVKKLVVGLWDWAQQSLVALLLGSRLSVPFSFLGSVKRGATCGFFWVYFE